MLHSFAETGADLGRQQPRQSVQLNSSEFVDDFSGYGRSPSQRDSASAPLAIMENPIFHLDRVDYTPTDRLKGLRVKSGIIAMAQNNAHVVTLDLASPADLEDVSFCTPKLQKKERKLLLNANTSSSSAAAAASTGNSGEQESTRDDDLPAGSFDASSTLRRRRSDLHALFLDPTGTHLLVSMRNGITYYLHSSWPRPRKPRALVKLRGVVIDSVAFDALNDDLMTTREILIGSSDGVIWRTTIEAKGVGKAEARYVLPAYSMNRKMPVTGLFCCRFPLAADKFFVCAATPSRLYQFIGGPTLADVFPRYEHNPVFDEMPEPPPTYGGVGVERVASLSVYAPQGGAPKALAWATSQGLYYGEVVLGKQAPGDRALSDTKLLPYPNQLQQQQPTQASSSDAADSSSSSSSSSHLFAMPPLDIFLTEFHFLLLWPNRFQAVSTLNNEIVCDERLDDFDVQRYGSLRAMTYDAVNDTLWAFAERSVFEVIVADEQRHVWSLYLQRGMFALALNYCKHDWQRSRVFSLQAEHYFERGDYQQAATFYGKGDDSFEEVTLKFIRAKRRDALIAYLLARVERAGRAERAQMHLMCTWLVELYVHKLNRLRQRGRDDAHRKLSKQFRAFLERRVEHIDCASAMALIGHGGRAEDLLHFASVVGDTERIVAHYANKPAPPPIAAAAPLVAYRRRVEQFALAIDVLERSPSSGGDGDELLYRYAPQLFAGAPFETVGFWIRRGEQLHQQGGGAKRLDVLRLLPALMRYEPANCSAEANGANQAIRFLQVAIGRWQCRDTAVHNYLVSLYAADADESQLLQFLTAPPSTKNAKPRYDLEFALRVCMQHKKLRSCVLIYSAMGHYAEAVELALRVDLQLAKINADKPLDQPELRKSLWLRIARHVIQYDQDVPKAMAFVNHCDLLRIEDLMPFLPDTVVIDDFKDEICASLEDYDRRIQQLRAAMQKATASATLIRDDAAAVANKSGFVSDAQLCELCEQNALTRRFFLFPCQHIFHADCLMTHFPKVADPVTLKRLSRAIASRSETVDQVIGAECVYCGAIMISSIDRPFIDNPSELDQWLID
jgi:vacuolar protein sorting-associated protein 18